MRQSGRISLVALLAAVGVVLLGILFMFAKESPASVGARFMNALSKGDVDTLTSLSYISNKTPEQIRKEWEFSTQTAGKYYTFTWNITGAPTADSQTAAVKLQIMRNAASGSSYEENFALPMIKQDDKWKVDVVAISREMYPGLPRANSQ